MSVGLDYEINRQQEQAITANAQRLADDCYDELVRRGIGFDGGVEIKIVTDNEATWCRVYVDLNPSDGPEAHDALEPLVYGVR